MRFLTLRINPEKPGVFSTLSGVHGRLRRAVASSLIQAKPNEIRFDDTKGFIAEPVSLFTDRRCDSRRCLDLPGLSRTRCVINGTNGSEANTWLVFSEG